MHRTCTLVLLGALAFGPGAAAASMSLNGFAPKVLPVLVQVDSHGKVVGVSPSVELAPRYDRLLRQTLDRMITRPANRNGHPVASQFVINLGLQASPRPDGDYDARFVYVSTSPVPAGSWFWVHVDGHRLALQSRHDLSPRSRLHWRQPHGWRPVAPSRADVPVRHAPRHVAPARQAVRGRRSR